MLIAPRFYGSSAKEQLVNPGKDFWFLELEDIAAGEFRIVYTLPAEKHPSDEPSISPVFVNGICAPLEWATGNGPNPANPKEDIRRVATKKVALKSGDVVALGGMYTAGIRELKLVKELTGDFWLPAFRVEDGRREKKVDFTGTTMTPGTFSVVLNNMLGKPGTYKVVLGVKDYWRKDVATAEKTVELNDTATVTLPFPVDGTSESYRGSVVVTLPSGEKVDWMFTCAADVSVGAHRRLSLDKDWEVTWVEDDGTYATRCFRERPPETAAWKKVDLPHTLKSWSKVPKAHQRWFRKKLTIPAAHRGERYELEIERGSPLTKVWVNGVCVGTNEFARIGTYLRYDLTSALKPEGENDIFIACQERTRSYRDEDLKTAKTLDDSGAMLYGWNGYTWGVFGLTSLVTTPTRCILREPKILTSVRNKTIEVLCDVPGGCTVAHRVLDRGREVVPAFTGKTTWANPILWGPTEFPLLELESTITDTASGKVLDVRRTRFGFREIWTDGLDLKWNGKTVRGSGRAMMPRWGENHGADRQFVLNYHLEFKKNNNVFGRHQAGIKDHYDMTDELGLLCVKGMGTTPVGCYPAKYRNNPVYWENFRKSCLMMAADYPNNPSIFTWYLSNEFYFESFPEAQAAIAPTISALQKADPMRFCETGCDIDCGGRTEIISTHYPLSSPFNEETVWLPNMFFWRPLDKMFAKGLMVPCGLQSNVANQYVQSPIKWGTKPIFVNETNWDYFMGYPHGPSRVWSDAAYLGAMNVDRLQTLYAIDYLKGERDAESTCITNWRHMNGDDTNVVLPPEDAFVIQKYHAFYAGTPVRYDIDFMHDIFKTEQVVRYWKLIDNSTHAKIAGERLPWNVDFCEFSRHAARFSAPKAGVYTFEYGIEGRVKKAFVLKTYAKESTKGLLTSKQIVKAADPITAELLQRVEAGEAVILLPRADYPEELPVTLRMTQRKSAINFSFRPNHPILRGIDAAALSYWYPNHATGDKYFTKPASGSVKTLIEAGGPNGLCYAALVEIPYGKGAFLATRLDLDPEVNPVAAHLLRNMLAYHPQNAAGTLAVLFEETSPVFNRLKKLGVTHARVTPEAINSGDYAAVYVDGAVFKPEMVAGFKGRIIVRNPSEAWRVTRRALPYNWYRGRGVKQAGFDQDLLLEGLTNFDFFWRHHGAGSHVKLNFTDPKGAECDLGGREILGAKDLLYPRFLARKGKVLMEDLNWIDAAVPVQANAERIITTIFANAGVKVTGSRAPSVPKNLVYSPVDLSAFLTRSLADDVENDGQGGWSDQGPTQDMRQWNISAGVHHLGNADYQICRPNTLFALKSKYRKSDNLPESVTIPVNRTADWLFWLHGAAWCSKQDMAKVTVAYADGTSLEIAMSGVTNMRDYPAKTPEAPFVNELDTVTTCAATAPHKLWGQGSVYSTGWKNPKTKVAIKSVTFTSMNRGVVMILGLTTAVPGVDKPVKRDIVKCTNLMAEADAARKAGDKAKARDLLKAAVAADPERIEPHQDIGDLAMELDDPEDALKHYRISLDMNYNQPPLWTKEKTAEAAVQKKKGGK